MRRREQPIIRSHIQIFGRTHRYAVNQAPRPQEPPHVCKACLPAIDSHARRLGKANAFRSVTGVGLGTLAQCAASAHGCVLQAALTVLVSPRRCQQSSVWPVSFFEACEVAKCRCTDATAAAPAPPAAHAAAAVACLCCAMSLATLLSQTCHPPVMLCDSGWVDGKLMVAWVLIGADCSMLLHSTGSTSCSPSASIPPALYLIGWNRAMLVGTAS